MLKLFRNGKRAAFIPFIVAGDPSLAVTEKIASVLIEEGADLLELGVPFSDALADGPVIQAASERASKIVPQISEVIHLAERIIHKNSISNKKIPIILFTYYNPILRLGVEEFARQASSAGIWGVLVVDLPPEEAKSYLDTVQKHGLKTVFLASPTTLASRVSLISDSSTGFIYYVSRTGVTGVQSELSQSLEEEVSRLRKLTNKSIAVGFGISTPEHARVVAGLADAVVVGSAFVRLMSTSLDPIIMEKQVREFARSLVEEIR